MRIEVQNGTVQSITGVFADVFNILRRNCNFRHELIETNSQDATENVKMVHSGRAHMALVPASLWFTQHEPGEISMPFVYSPLYILTKAPEERVLVSLRALLVMDLNSFLGCVLFLTLLILIMASSVDGTLGESRSKKLLRSSLQHLRQFINEPLFKRSPCHGSSFGLASACWLFFTFFMVAFIGAYLKSEFSISDPDFINSVEDLLRHGDVKIYLMSGSMEEFYFRDASDTRLRSIYERANREGSIIDFFDFFCGKPLEELDARKAAYIIDINYFFSVYHSLAIFEDGRPIPKNLYYADQPIFTNPMGTITSKMIPPRIDECLEYWIETMFSTSPYMNLKYEFLRESDEFIWKKGEGTTVEKLRLISIIGCFAILVVGLAVASLVCFLENVTFSLKKNPSLYSTISNQENIEKAQNEPENTKSATISE